MLSTLYPEKGSVWTFILLYINLIDTKTFVHIHFLLHQQKLVTFAWYKTHMIMNQIFRMSLYLLMVVLWMASCHNPLWDADRDALYAQLKRADSCSRHKQEEQAILYYLRSSIVCMAIKPINPLHFRHDGSRSGCFIGGNEAFVCLTK